MGGVTKYPYPKQVWSPAGGWWYNPTQWKRNTFVGMLTMACILTPFAIYSEKHTKQYLIPHQKLDQWPEDKMNM